MNDTTPEERRKIVKALRDSGMTFAKIGNHMGFSVERARQLYIRALRDERREKAMPHLMAQLEEARKHDARYVFSDCLPARACNALWRIGINTVDELRAASPERIKNARNIGKKTFDLIMKVRGYDE